MNYFLHPSQSTLSQLLYLSLTKLRFSFFALMFLIFSCLNTNAQSITFNHSVPTSLTVCGTEEIFEVEITNTSGSSLNNNQISIDFPTGVTYVPSSLNESSSYNLAEQDITDLSSITFRFNNLPEDQTLKFTIEAKAEFEAYNTQLAGSVFINTISIFHQDGSTTEETDAYNILYPALSITQVSPMSSTVFVGERYTRTVTVVNGGYGSLSTFEIKNVENSNIELNSVDIGLLDINSNTITFSSSDFTAFGNGDNSFDQNESMTFTQTLTAVACNSAQSSLTAFWGCTGEDSDSNTKYPYTTIQLFPPALNITPQASLNTCMDGSPNTQQLLITNNGSGPANRLEIIISPEEQHSVTEIDASSITYTLNGNSNSLTASNTTPAYLHSCFSANAIDGFTVNLPTIQPGETLTLSWENYTCASQSCGNVHYVAWNYEGEYTDMCDSKTYEIEGIGQQEYEKGFSTFFESPSDLVDQQTGTYSFIISSATFRLPEGNSPYFEVVFDIPEGLIWEGGANDLTYTCLLYTSPSPRD